MSAHDKKNTSIISIGYARTESLPLDQLKKISRSILTPDENERASNFQFEVHQQSFLAGCLLTRHLLSEAVGQSPDSLKFETNKYGKPFLVQSASEEYWFNRSRSTGIVVVALTRVGEVGIDIEHRRRKIETNEIADRFFSPRETAALKNIPPANRTNEFFRYWTLKEAYIKAQGQGLSIPLDSFSFQLGNGPPRIRFEESDSMESPIESPADWTFFENSLPPDYQMAIAIKADHPEMLSCEIIDQTNEVL